MIGQFKLGHDLLGTVNADLIKSVYFKFYNIMSC